MGQVIAQEYEAAVAVNSIMPHPDNPRRGDVEAITESIATNGFFGACIAQRATRYILVGNHRWRAAKAEGLTHVPVFWLDVNDTQARRIMAVDNRVNDLAGYDELALARLLDSMSQDEPDLLGSGYSPLDMAELLQRLGDGALSLGSARPLASGPGMTLPPPSSSSGQRTASGVRGGDGSGESDQRPTFKEYDETVEDDLPTEMCAQCSRLCIKPGAKASW